MKGILIIMDNKNNESKKEIKVISGETKNLLNFSEVYDHIKSSTDSKNEKNKKKEIVIPKGNLDKKTD